VSNRRIINKKHIMKTSKLLSLVLVAATAGLAVFGLANTEFSARLPLEVLLGVTVTLGLLRVAFSDYSRRPKSLPLPMAAVLRPESRRIVRLSAQIERVAA